MRETKAQARNAQACARAETAASRTNRRCRSGESGVRGCVETNEIRSLGHCVRSMKSSVAESGGRSGFSREPLFRCRLFRSSFVFVAPISIAPDKATKADVVSTLNRAMRIWDSHRFFEHPLDGRAESRISLAHVSRLDTFRMKAVSPWIFRSIFRDDTPKKRAPGVFSRFPNSDFAFTKSRVAKRRHSVVAHARGPNRRVRVDARCASAVTLRRAMRCATMPTQRIDPPHRPPSRV